ncbi:suppressor of glycerol defect [Friedmanniomyces endolithicus]|nr:suppressor of glycerol defect [Friedmanniomyces endolithicus]
MNRNDYRGPKLPKALLDRVGGAEKKARGNVSRKDRRKAEREAKKGEKRIAPARRVDRPERRRQVTERRHDEDAAEEVVRPIRSTTKQAGKPLKSVLKPAKSVKSEERQDASETDIEIDGNNDDGEDDQRQQQATAPSLSPAKQRKPGKKRTKDVGDDELDWMVTGSDESDDEAMGLKRKRPDDERWLKDKRRKAGMKEVAEEEDHGDEESMEDIADADAEFDDVDNPFSDDELSIGDFDGFDSEHDSEVPPPAKKQRENPYVAPVSQATILTGKYVPPSLRKPASSEEEAIKNLRRQTQGQLNRLSDANLPSILQSMEELYTKHARQHVTSTLIDLLVSLVSDPSPLNDPFIILHAGFATAVYKVIGPDFGAQLLEEVTKAFDQHSQSPDGASEGGKNRVNLIAFLSNLYTFQLVASPILYDYIRLLLNDLSEPNTELLLRILRTSGSQLRHEDPTALKDIVILLQRHTTEKGEDNLSVRTKYMMEIITDLKNNRHGLKTGVIASALAAEHTTRMKKILGSLNTRGSLRATEPLRVTLADLSESGKKGKWWLVGASYHDHSKATLNSSANTSVTTRALRNVGEDTGYDSATPGHTNLTQAARAQGMNTDIRRQISIQGLGLRGKQLEQEVPRVLLHCVGVEEGFNRFYGLVARELCGSGVAAGGSGAVGKGFRVGFWGVLKELKDGEEGDGSEGEEDGGRDGMGVRKIVNLAKFYGSLIADEIVSLTALKTADFALLRPDTKAFTFAEVLFTTLFLELRKKSKKSRDTKAPSGYGEEVQRMFEEASKAPQMIAGLQRFLREVVAAARLAQGAKGVAGVKEGCNIAVEALGRAAEEGAGLGSDEESDED